MGASKSKDSKPAVREAEAPANKKAGQAKRPKENVGYANVPDRAPSSRILVISSNLEDELVLAAAVQANVGVVVYDYDTTTLPELLARIQNVAQGREGHLDSIGFIDHGAPGMICLVKAHMVDHKTITQNSEVQSFLENVGKLTNGMKYGQSTIGRVDFLACNVGATKEGAKLEKELEVATDRNCAISTNKTGKGGDFILESDNIDAKECYFEPLKLKHWKHAASFWNAVATAGGTVICLPIVAAMKAKEAILGEYDDGE